MSYRDLEIWKLARETAIAVHHMRDQSTAVLDSISLAQGAEWEERIGGMNGGPNGQ